MVEDLIEILALSFIRESKRAAEHIINLSPSSRFITNTLWFETLMNTSSSKERHLENRKNGSNYQSLTSFVIYLHSKSLDLVHVRFR